MTAEPMLTIGKDCDADRWVQVPMPPDGGSSALIGGSAGSGKSRLIHMLLCQAARLPHTAIVISDPAVMEFEPLWNKRASCIALGRQGGEIVLELVEHELHRRLRLGRKMDVRVLPVTEETPRLLFVVDEVAILTLGGVKNAANRLIDIAQVGRKVRIGLILGTQGPRATVVPMLVREQLSTRIALRCLEPEQTDCILGTQRIPAHKIPADQPGRAWALLQNGTYAQVRVPFVSDAQILEVATATAHLTPTLNPAHGWRPVIDPYADGDDE